MSNDTGKMKLYYTHRWGNANKIVLQGKSVSL